METKNSILNALLQQAIFNSQGVGANVPVNLSMSLNDERSEVTSSSSSVEDESPADLSSRSNHRDDSPTPPHYQHHPDSSQLMHAMAAAFSFQRDLLAQQQNKSELHQPDIANSSLSSSPDPSHLVAKALASATMRRPRSEKKPIPDDLKDGKYFERRRRNNLAAKRSRDMRKNREDQVTVRANFLEKENSVLRAQVATLRDEAFALKQMLLHKQASAILRSQAATS
ncbi:hepatic leukemia factor-like [Daphnia carinata]|uniref:hepatic leukemia factor-like n=1 Tax=Daphnia carinata TaxID=120202 RepID=UPI002580D69A|nr:hepatic leukemia factor-like [Daphnia carinata]